MLLVERFITSDLYISTIDEKGTQLKIYNILLLQICSFIVYKNKFK